MALNLVHEDCIYSNANKCGGVLLEHAYYHLFVWCTWRQFKQLSKHIYCSLLENAII